MYIFDENDEYFRRPSGGLETPGTVELKIKLMRGAVKNVLVYLSPDGEPAHDVPMEFVYMTGSYEVYRCTLSLESPGLYWYSFLINKTDGSTITVPENAGDAFQITGHAPTLITPDWIKGGLIYHIFVDRFRRGGELHLRPGAVFRPDWDGCPRYMPDADGIVQNNDFFGGDLYGIIEKLPYLEELGVTCIYLSPVFDAASNHKYDTGDYMRIDPAFGGDDAFRQLCAEAGAHGISVILDGVFNHVGVDSRYFNKYGSYDSVGAFQDWNSPYSDWFTFREDGKYDSWWGIELLPSTNKNSESFRDFICSNDGVIAHWTKMGVSGWRLDVVDELPDVFLYPLCEAIKRENNDSLIIGEVWEDASNKISYSVRRRYFLGGQLDGVTNYPLKDAIITLVKYGAVERLASVMDALGRNYPRNIRQTLMNVLGSHDTVRVLTALSDANLPSSKNDMEYFRLSDAERETAKRRLKLASLLQFTLPGVPCVYYGDEAGMEGCGDPFNRRCFPWGAEDTDLIDWYIKLSRLRKEYSCFKYGAYKLVEARAGVFAFVRGEGAEQVLIAVNTTDNDRNLNALEFNFDVLNNEYSDTLTVKTGQPGMFIIK